MIISKYAFSVVLFFLFCVISFSQEPNYRVMFYNVENCFDTVDDSLNLADNEFLPGSKKQWTYTRYKTKLDHIARVIMTAGQWQPPALVGLCEIENQGVVKNLINWTGLKELNYRFVHFESRDRRGIDVALLYRSNFFKPLSSKSVLVQLPSSGFTRDILMVKGLFNQKDTLFLLVNHWPSRSGGEEASDPLRQFVSNRVVSLCDSVRRKDAKAHIIIMGDFNATSDESCIISLTQSGFINMTDYLSQKGSGSYKYRSNWELIDQILVSDHFLSLMKTRQLQPSFRIIDLPFLLTDDPSYPGKKPFRTYLGPAYIGGYSDHLPVMADFVNP